MADNKGLWLDKDTGKVVKKQPSRARLLVSPGKDANSETVKALVSRYEENYETASAPDDTEKTVASAPAKTVTTGPVSAKAPSADK